MDFLIIGIAAFFISGLTLFSGFGLGTLLMPFFAIFFPVEVAVAATAIVHISGNAVKLGLFIRMAQWKIVLRFGLPAIVAAVAGAWLLNHLAGFRPLISYTLGKHLAEVTPVKLIIAALIFIFALFELIPRFKSITFDSKYLPLGGALSGFFGGLSGHQGAFRAAFLAKAGLTAIDFVATNAVIAFMVDAARIPVYARKFFSGTLSEQFGPHGWKLVGAATLCAIAGLVLGRIFIGNVTMTAIQNLVGVLLIIIALAFGFGLI